MPRPTHFDIPADDPERVARFYETVFGWTIQKWDGPMEYWLVTTGPEGTPGINGGISRRSGPGGVTNTIAVDSIDEYLAKVTGGGGAILMGKTEVPSVGLLAVCADTEGNPFGIMETFPGV